MSGTPRQIELGSAVPHAAPAPHPETVAQVASHLARLASDPDSADSLSAVGADIQKYRLVTFFHAANQELVEQPARVPQAVPNLTLGVDMLSLFELRHGDDGSLRETWSDYIGSRMSQ